MLRTKHKTEDSLAQWQVGGKEKTAWGTDYLRAGELRIPYRFYLPEQPDAARVLVLLHGISRNAEELIKAFLPAARAAGYLLIAPTFEAHVCPDYQRLGRWGKGPRIDFMLQAILENVGSMAGLTITRADWFGFSAGAQLAHRFAFAYPQRVRKLALGAAGWYTLPTARRYPQGLRLQGELPGVVFQPERFLRCPVRVFVGDGDTERDESLNTSRRIDKSQGLNRLQRAENWVCQMNHKARQRGLPAPVDLDIMPAVGHSFGQACQRYDLPEKIVDWLLASPGPTKTRGKAK